MKQIFMMTARNDGTVNGSFASAVANNMPDTNHFGPTASVPLIFWASVGNVPASTPMTFGTSATDMPTFTPLTNGESSTNAAFNTIFSRYNLPGK